MDTIINNNTSTKCLQTELPRIYVTKPHSLSFSLASPHSSPDIINSLPRLQSGNSFLNTGPNIEGPIILVEIITLYRFNDIKTKLKDDIYTNNTTSNNNNGKEKREKKEKKEKKVANIKKGYFKKYSTCRWSCKRFISNDCKRI